jgi:hypothetical protein
MAAGRSTLARCGAAPNRSLSGLICPFSAALDGKSGVGPSFV